MITIPAWAYALTTVLTLALGYWLGGRHYRADTGDALALVTGGLVTSVQGVVKRIEADRMRLRAALYEIAALDRGSPLDLMRAPQIAESALAGGEPDEEHPE